jgi:hypothetical protein
MKVLRIVVLLLAMIGGAYAIKRLVAGNSEVVPLDPMEAGVPLAPVPDGGMTV